VQLTPEKTSSIDGHSSDVSGLQSASSQDSRSQSLTPSQDITKFQKVNTRSFSNVAKEQAQLKSLILRPSPKKIGFYYFLFFFFFKKNILVKRASGRTSKQDLTHEDIIAGLKGSEIFSSGSTADNDLKVELWVGFFLFIFRIFNLHVFRTG